MARARGQHLIGKVLGSCVLEKLLGYGGTSAVFLAQQRNPMRKVAVKVFLSRTPMDIQRQREFYTRFLHEAEAASKLDHPNILPIYSYGEQDGIPYIVMPYMAGGTLSDYMAKRGSLSAEEVQWYLEQITSALGYAHERGFVHCDVKPANMLLDSEGHIMLSDFGIACFAPPGGVALEQSEQKGQEAMVGTPDYISPEQALGRQLDGRSDIYSLGVMLFFLLSKRLPFKAESAIALALMHLHEPPPSLLSIRSDLSSRVDMVVARAMAKKPEARYQSADNLYQAFSEAIAPETQEVPIPPRLWTSPKAVKAARRRRGKLGIVGGVGVLLLFIIATLFSTSYIISLWRGSNGHDLGSSMSASIGNSAVDLLSQQENWPQSSTFFYDAQNYHIINRSSEHVALALYNGHAYGDIHMEVTMVRVKGEGGDYYGVVFRCTSDQSSYYLFEIVTSGSGSYVFLRNEGPHTYYLAAGSSSDIVTGGRKSNTLAIDARGNTFNFHVNGKQLGKAITDKQSPSRGSGQVGLYVEDKGTEVSYSHLYVNETRS